MLLGGPQRLGHVNEVTWNFQRDFRRHGSRSCLLVAKMFVHRDEIASCADGAQVRHAAAGVGQILFRKQHQSPSESPAFQFRTEGKQADIAAIAAYFRVDTTSKPRAVFQDEEPAVAKEWLQFFCVD